MSAETLLAFCGAAPLGDRPAAVRHALLTELCRGPEGVFDLIEGDARLVAVLVERISTASGAAILEPLAARGAHTAELRLVLIERAIAAAEALIQGARPIQLSPPPGWTGLEPTLEARGFGLSHIVYTLATAEDHRPAPRAPLPAGLAWEPCGEAHLSALHAMTQAAFAGRPDVAFPAFEAWATMVRAAEIPPRVLLHDRQVVGSATVAMLAPGLGQVRNIGRDPAWIGRRLGPILLGEAMNLLAEAGASRFTLSVLASNRAALSLYQGAGFEMQQEERVFLRA